MEDDAGSLDGCNDEGPERVGAHGFRNLLQPSLYLADLLAHVIMQLFIILLPDFVRIRLFLVTLQLPGVVIDI